MLWSKSIFDADSACPSQAIRLRNGESGTNWAGYKVGSHVHDMIQAHLSDEEAPSMDGLSCEEMVACERLMKRFMEFELSIPKGAWIEKSLLSEIGDDGVPVEWIDAPPWAIRGEDWDPSTASDKTYFRIQPDVAFVDDDGVIVLFDWKTAWGLPSDSKLEKDTQAITYCAALADRFPKASLIRFVWWNVRYQKGQMIERSPDEWRGLAYPLFKACRKKDLQDESVSMNDIRPGDHCGMCKYSRSCLVEVPDEERNTMDDAELYKYSQRLSELSKQIKSGLNERLKERTGVLELESGTRLGPINKTYQRWDKGKKSLGMREAFSELEHEDGVDPFKFFDVKGSLNSWIESLPDGVRAAVEPHVVETNRQVFVETE